jgi:hypothetical protein
VRDAVLHLDLPDGERVEVRVQLDITPHSLARILEFQNL